MTYPSFRLQKTKRGHKENSISFPHQLASALIQKFSLYSCLGFGKASCDLCNEPVQDLQGGDVEWRVNDR